MGGVVGKGEIIASGDDLNDVVAEVEHENIVSASYEKLPPYCRVIG